MGLLLPVRNQTQSEDSGVTTVEFKAPVVAEIGCEGEARATRLCALKHRYARILSVILNTSE